MQQLIITTAGRPDAVTEEMAQRASSALAAPFFLRKKRSIARLQKDYPQHALLIAHKDRYDYYAVNATEPFFFHPNSAAFRLKRVARGEVEPLLEALALIEGATVLDCTLGLGADAMLAAYAVGASGRVVGLEANRALAFVVAQGMQMYNTSQLPLTQVMRTIEVVASDALHYLQQQADNSFDVVYMDPMFDACIDEATNFTALRTAGAHIALDEAWITEAKRVAKKRVVLKAHFRSPWFQRFDFVQKIRPNTKFHYGIYNKNS